MAVSVKRDERCRFEVDPASAYPGDGYDLAAVFDLSEEPGTALGAQAGEQACARS